MNNEYDKIVNNDDNNKIKIKEYRICNSENIKNLCVIFLILLIMCIIGAYLILNSKYNNN